MEKASKTKTGDSLTSKNRGDAFPRDSRKPEGIVFPPTPLLRSVDETNTANMLFRSPSLGRHHTLTMLGAPDRELKAAARRPALDLGLVNERIISIFHRQHELLVDQKLVAAEASEDPAGDMTDDHGASSTRRSSITLVGTTPLDEKAFSTKDDCEGAASRGTVTETEDIPSGSAGDLESVDSYAEEGSAPAYCTAAGAFLVMFSTFSLSNSWGALFAELSKSHLENYSDSLTSFIGSSHIFVVFIMGLFAGRLFDLGYFQYQLAAGSCLWVIGIFMLSLSTQFYQIYLTYSICLGLALGLIFASSISCVGSYFLRRRAFMIGVVSSGVSLGSVVLPILMNHLFLRFGFARTVRLIGYLQGAALLVANLIMRPRKLPQKTPVPILPLVRGFLCQLSTWLCCIGACLMMLGMFIPIFYIQVFAESHHSSPFVIENSVAIINGAALVSRLVGGHIADRVGVFNCAIPLVFCTGVLAFAMLGATSTASSVVFVILYGMTSGGWISIMLNLFMALASDVTEIGVRAGLGFIFVGTASLIGPPVAGALLRAAGGAPDGYWAPCIFGGTVMLLGSGFMLACRSTQVKRRGGSWKV